MNSTEESGSVPSVVEADVVSQNSSSNSQLVDEVFSLVKGYLNSQLEEKGKRFERSSKSDKEQGRPGGVVEYQYTQKKIDKIPQNTPYSSKYTQK